METEQRQAALLRNVFLALIGTITDDDIHTAGLSKFSVQHLAPDELSEISVIAKQKKRAVLKTILN